MFHSDHCSISVKGEDNPQLHRNIIGHRPAFPFHRTSQDAKSHLFVPFYPSKRSNQPIAGKRPQPTACKRLPDMAHVLPSGQVFVGLKNGIPRVEEIGVARLNFHRVNQELEEQGVAVFGDRTRLGVRDESLVETGWVGEGSVGVRLR